jgi:hypothetical protein
MFVINKEEAEIKRRLKRKSFSEIGWTEDSEIEELVSNKLEEVIYSGESNKNMLLIGRQVVDNTEGRNDLVAIDEDGDLILIELKRDKKDLNRRKENVESQAIRYVSSLADLSSVSSILELYYNYVERYKEKEDYKEYARNRLREFFEDYNIDENDLNNNQKIVLFSSSYTEKALSSLAWLSKNGIDIRVIRGNVYEYKGEMILYAEKILPVSDEDEYFAGIKPPNIDESNGNKGTIRMKELMREGKISEGDELAIPRKKQDPRSTAVLKSYNEVDVDGDIMSPNQWAQDVLNRSASIYRVVKHVKSDKMLRELRQEVREESRI